AAELDQPRAPVQGRRRRNLQPLSLLPGCRHLRRRHRDRRRHLSMNPVRGAAGISRAWSLVAALAVLLAACSDGAEPTAGGNHGVNPTAASGPLALSADGRTLWVVNPDADSVTAVDVTDPAAPV